MKKFLSILLASSLLVAAIPQVAATSDNAKPALDPTHPSYRPDDGWRTHPEDYKLIVITFDGFPDSGDITKQTNVKRMIDAVYNCGGGSAIFDTRADTITNHGMAQPKYAMDRGFELGIYVNDPVDERDPNRDGVAQLAYYPIEEQRALIKNVYDTILEKTGVAPKWLRPPYLHANEDTRTVCAELGIGMLSGGYSKYHPDGNGYYSTEGKGLSVENYVACGYDGTFWISHPHAGGAPYLEQALPILYDMGFRFCTATEMLEYRNVTMEAGKSYGQVLREKNPLINVTAGNVTGGTLTFGEYAVDGKESLVNTVSNQVIRVKATPDEGRMLVPGSLTYTAGGVTKPIVNKNMKMDKLGEGDGYSFEFVAPEQNVTVNAVFVSAENTDFTFDTIGSSIHQNSAGVYDGIRFLTRINFGKFDTSTDTITVRYNGETYTVAKIGMLLKRGENTADLTLDNYRDASVNTSGVNRIWNAVAYDAARGTFVASDYTDAYVDVQVQMMKDAKTDVTVFRNRKFTARGYLVLKDAGGHETVLYSASQITKCVNDMIPPKPLKPEYGEIEAQ